jgi:hypothetical protein
MDQPTAIENDDAFWGTPTAPAGPPSGSTDPAAAGAERPRTRRPARTWVAAGVGAAVIGAASIVGLNLARHESTTLAGGNGGGAGGFGGAGGPGGPGTFGTITAINGSTLTITSPMNGAVTVTTSSSTAFTTATAGTVSSIKVGDNVSVFGTTPNTTVAATRITDSGMLPVADGRGPDAGTGAPPGGATAGGPPAGLRGDPPTSGVVTSVNGSSFALKTADGTVVTVTTSSDTTVTLVQPSSLGALKVGDQVQVSGTTTNGTLDATSVRSGVQFGFGGGRPPAAAQ